MGNRFMAATIISCYLWIATGCTVGIQASSRYTRLRLEPLYKGSLCNFCSSKPTVAWLNSIQQFNAQHELNFNLSTASTIKDPLLLLICMGRRPSGGFYLDVADTFFTVQNKRASLKIVWKEPNPEALVTQAITCPFLLLALEKGPYQSLTIIDQHGIVRAVTSP